MFQYVSLGIVAFMILMVVIYTVKAVFRGLKKTVGSLVAILLSAITAGIVTALICKPSSGLMNSLIGFVVRFIPDGKVKDLLSVEALGDAVSYYGVMLLAPFVFALLFSLVLIVFSIVIAILVKVIPPYKKPGMLLNRLGGAGVGLVCGLLVSIFVLTPVVGTMDLIGSMSGSVDQLTQTEDGTSSENGFVGFVSDASDSTAVKIFKNVGCGLLYNVLASGKFEGEKIYLKNDLKVMTSMIDGVSVLGEPMTEYDNTQVEALESIIVDLDSSALLRHTAAGLFSTAADKWMAGESFMDMKKPDPEGDLLDPVVDEMLEIMVSSTKDTIGKDLATMKDVFAVMIDHELLKMSSDYSEMLDKFSQDGVISDLLHAVTANERMLPLADCITDLSIRALATQIGIPENADEVYGMLMEELATVLNDSKYVSGDRSAAIENDLSAALGNYGIPIDGEAVSHIADSIVNDLGNMSYVSAEDVSEFFTVYAIAKAEADNGMSGKGYRFDILSDSNVPTFTFNSDGTVSVDGRVLKNYSAYNLQASAAFNMGNRGWDLGAIDTLFSAETMESQMITMEQLLSLLGQYSDIENIDAEVEKLAAILTEAAVVFGDMDTENADMNEVISKMGGLLDKIRDTELFGDDMAQKLLTAVMQSNMITDQVGLSREEITNFAAKVGDMVNNTDGTYSDATVAVSGTINMMESITDTNKTPEEKKEATKQLLDDLTPESAEALGSMVTSSMVADMGAPAENAESISGTVSSMLNNMAHYEDGGDSAKTEKEVEAVNQVLDMAMNIGENDTDIPVFSTETEVGMIDSTVEEFVDLIAGSDVISQTLVETVYEQGFEDNPLGIPELNAEQQEMAIDAIHSYYNDNGGGAELAQKLEALATVLNLSVDLY